MTIRTQKFFFFSIIDWELISDFPKPEVSQGIFKDVDLPVDESFEPDLTVFDPENAQPMMDLDKDKYMEQTEKWFSQKVPQAWSKRDKFLKIHKAVFLTSVFVFVIS